MAEQYLFKLAKHFAKKVPVHQQPRLASIEFEFGHCVLEVQGPSGDAPVPPQAQQTLHVRCHSADAQQLARLHSVLESHLALMTRREPLQLHWETLA